MMHAPSSSAPRESGSRRWLTCAAKAAPGSGPRSSELADDGPPCRAIESRIMARNSWSVITLAQGHGIDDTDDRGVDRRGLAAERLAGGAALEDDEHFLVHPG